MMEKRRFFRGGYVGILASVVCFLLAGNCTFAAEQASPSGEAAHSYRIFSLKHLSVEQGEKYLAEVITGTVTHIPGTSALLVTAGKSELTKARTVLDLVDGPEHYVIKKLFPLSAVRKMPSNEQIAARLSPSLTRGVSIGNFSDPPSANASARAIIDIYNDAVIAIAPAGLLERIVAAIGQLPQTPELKEQNKPKASNSSQPPARRKVSDVTEPNGAKFLLTANSAVKTEPNTVTVSPQQQKPKPSAVGQPYEQAPILDGDQVVNLSLAERQKLSIADLLGLVGPYLQLDFMYDDKDLTAAGDISFNPNGKYRGPIKVKDLYPLLEQALKVKGLAMTRGKGNLVTIVPVANALEVDPTFLKTAQEKIELGDGVIQKVFQLKYADISNAQRLLEGMKLSTNITAIPETRTLIITAYAYRMPRIETMLDIIDKPGEPKKFRFRALRYTMAKTLAPKLQTLAEQLGTVSITVGETSETKGPTVATVKRPGETNAQYQARLRAEAAIRARQLASMRQAAAAAATQQPESGPPPVYLDADERTNRILMIGLAKQLDEVEELIDTLDVARQDLRTLQLYKIEHIDATEARKKLEELGVVSPSTATESMRLTEGAKPTGTTTVMPPKYPTTRTSPTRGFQTSEEETEALAEEPQVIVIEPTNSLLANATAEQHKRIAQILKYVDSETNVQEIPYKLYPLENQSPDHLAQVLQKLIQETVTDKQGKIQKVIPKQEEQITIVPDPNTFSLVVYASKKNQEWIANLVKQLDQPRPQVLIDVTLVQISKNDAFNYDLNMLSSFPDLTSTSGLTSAIMPGAQDGNLVSALTNSNRNRFIDLQSNSGSGTGFYGDRHINALLTLMQEKDYGRVLAKPKILVNDNQQGTISTTDTTYVTKTSSIPVTSAGAGQNATLVQTAVDYAPYDAGITLKITPHISRGDFLRLDIDLQRSDFGTITGQKPPDTTQSNVTTTVTIPDQSTIILGGLLKLNQSKGGTKIPILGDIPLIGGLFRNASNSDIQRNLYVFVKAEIIEPEDKSVAKSDLKDISEQNQKAFENYETEFQQYPDWPGIKPKPMTPPKVLEAQ
jgi:general secretion pathway protein D